MAGKYEKTARVATISEALEILEERQKSGDLGYEQKLAFEYAKKFSKLGSEKAEKLKKELEELGLSDRIAATIVTVMPSELMQLKQILANEKKAIEPEVAEKVMPIVEGYRSKG